MVLQTGWEGVRLLQGPREFNPKRTQCHDLHGVEWDVDLDAPQEGNFVVQVDDLHHKLLDHLGGGSGEDSGSREREIYQGT